VLGLGLAATLYYAPKGPEERAVRVRFPDAVTLSAAAEIEVAFRRADDPELLTMVRVSGAKPAAPHEFALRAKLPNGPLQVTASVSTPGDLRTFAGKVTVDGPEMSVRVHE